MTSTSIVCQICRDLVPVVEKTIAVHGDCPMSGMRYVPSPRTFQQHAGGPKIEIIASQKVYGSCDKGHDHARFLCLAKITPPKAELN
jgi:hypothetical protein